jgi:hypothetical protein
LELGDQVADQHRVAVVFGIAAAERVLRALSDHRRRGHVPTGLAEHASCSRECT